MKSAYQISLELTGSALVKRSDGALVEMYLDGTVTVLKWISKDIPVIKGAILRRNKN